jgi:hypothetical protein
MAQAASPLPRRERQHQSVGQLGPLLRWAPGSVRWGMFILVSYFLAPIELLLCSVQERRILFTVDLMNLYVSI